VGQVVLQVATATATTGARTTVQKSSSTPRLHR
jgi:hypothetical protein